MIRIALCDDDFNIRETAALLVEQYSRKTSNANIEAIKFESAKALREAIEKGKTFDIFILDIYIDTEMGPELARFIRKRGIESPIIFLTVSIEFAPQVFEIGTLRYLLKPINHDKFFEALDTALMEVEKLNGKLLLMKTENGIESVNINNILYSESQAHYQIIRLSNGTQLKTRSTVKDLFVTLQKHGGFVRVGSAYIINLRNVKNVTTTEVNLFGDISVPIPRGKHTDIKSAFWDFQQKE